MSAVPPAYAYSPAPSYASLPLPNEDTVEYTPRAGRSEAVIGRLTKQWRGVTIIFKNQNESSDAPTYGRNSVISGEIGLDNPENIVSVTLKLEGRVNLSSSDCGSLATKILIERHTLWATHCSEGNKSGRCPSVVAFAVVFPTNYKDQGRFWRLPPSYEVTCLGSPLLVVKCMYMLSITITKTTNRRIPFWKNTSKTYPIHITFRPRTRPARPIFDINSLFLTLKVAPAEWHQMLVTIPTRRQAKVEPISCHFLIPSVQTYCLADSIPFHIQLCGPLESLRHFYGYVPIEAAPPPGKKPRRREYAAIVRVFLARQVFVEINGRQSWRNITVGEGQLRPIPPGASSTYSVDATEISVDWEGEVRCKNHVTCASFNINHLVVKDFIILAMTPANVRNSPFLPIQHAHPIRLVTDGWTDHDLAHPQDR
ncbi:hypothetical protein B0H10DRAFT_1782999 [Mycena sp. CBHHK59/15]|nr:hypothetical protein B0H10DRAFT_1782999 [Mycena sp. CBHHK59/15]